MLNPCIPIPFLHLNLFVSLLVLFLHIFSSALVGEENKRNKDSKDGKTGQQKVPTKSSITVGPRGPGNCARPCLTLLILISFLLLGIDPETV